MGRWQIKYVVVWGHMVEKAIHDLKLFMLQKFFGNPPHNFYHKNPNSSLWNVSSLKKFSFKYKMGSKGSKGDGGQIA